MHSLRKVFFFACFFIVLFWGEVREGRALPLVPDVSHLTYAQKKQAISELEAFLNQLHTLKGDFTQISPRGRASRGVFFLSKPGKMRFEYAPPTSLSLISDGTWVSIENKNKERADQYPLSTTPLKFILKEKVNFLKDANILRVEIRENLLWVTLEAKERLIPGQLTLGYHREEKLLKQWKVLDAQNRETTVILDHIERDVPLSEALFRVKSTPTMRSARDR